MKPKIKKISGLLNLVIPANVVGISLAPFGIFLRREYLKRKKTINHEKIHWQQQLEMGVIFFYIWYILEWLIKLFRWGNRSYNELSFEREAYVHDRDYDYLKNRKPYSWVKYIFKK